MPVLIEKQQPLPTEEAATPVVGTVETPEVGQDKGFFVSRRKMAFGQISSKAMTIAAIVTVVAIGAVFAMSHREGAGTDKPQAKKVATSVKPVAQSSAAYQPGDRAVESSEGKGDQAVTPSDVENTKNSNPDADSSIANPERQIGPAPPKYAATQSVRTNLGAVPPFQAPTYMYGASAVPPIPSINTAGGTEQARQYQDAVMKPSYVFASQSGSTGAGSEKGSEPVTNFGLEPGFHLPAHLESSVSTLGGVPAVAIIEYNYVRDGRVVIPAGSRVIGKIGGASSTGLVQITFTEIYLPNGTTIPISAVALDSSLHLIKGVVTGKNTGKQIILGTLSSAGSLGAGFLSSNSNSITQTQLARNQIAANLGQSGDQAIQQLQVGQSIVVTVPSGVLVYVTFVAPVRGVAAGTAAGTSHTAAVKN